VIEVVAEIGCNHNGSLEIAAEMIHGAALAGVQAVKFQYYSAREIEEYEKKHPPSLYTPEIFKWIRKTELSLEELGHLRDICRSVGVEFLCTPFISPERVDDLNPLVERWKIRERDARRLEGNELFEAALATGKEVMASRTRLPVEHRWLFHPKIRWLYTIPHYPATFAELDLGKMASFQGYSNHVPSITAPLASAVISKTRGWPKWTIEVHVKPKRPIRVVDEAVSLTMEDLAWLVQRVIEVEAMWPRPSGRNQM